MQVKWSGQVVGTGGSILRHSCRLPLNHCHLFRTVLHQFSTLRPREAYQVKLRAESLIIESSTGSFEHTPLQTSLLGPWPPADQIHSKISTIPDNFQEQINKRPLRSKVGSYPPMLLQHGHSCYPRKRTQMQAFLTGRHQIRDVLALYEWKRRVSSCPEC